MLLKTVVEQQLLNKKNDIARHIIADVESVLITAALEYTQGKRHEAAILLGYGRNTLTRKIKELELTVP
jgi:two-component system nitrogen regulation response regulator GlnG